ncbi:MAG: hypothetical protein KN64_11575 [Sulfurovum sp. AS07-7]|nr:MAG: hypothetical protein KN64_11575 [Sulfurovum sp. AS07-7]
MNLITKNRRTVVILYPDIAVLPNALKMDFILTPHFYTYLKEELAVKYAFQAKQFASSLFDGLLEKEKNYSYHVIKNEQNEWEFFAYIPEDIEKFLLSKNITSSQIGKIYFAQQFPHLFEESVKLGLKDVIKNLNGIVTTIPLRILPFDHKFKNEESEEQIELKDGVHLTSSSVDTLLSFKDSVILSSLFVILGVIFLIQSFMIGNLDEPQARLQKLSDEHPNLSSHIIRDNIMKKYEKIDKEERFKRDTTQKISKLISNESNLSELNIRENQVYATINVKNQMIENQIKNQAQIEKLEVTSISPQKLKIGAKL